MEIVCYFKPIKMFILYINFLSFMPKLGYKTNTLIVLLQLNFIMVEQHPSHANALVHVDTQIKV